MTRSEAIKYVKQWDGQFPRIYLGKSIDLILEHINMTRTEFMYCVNTFANKELFNIHLVGAPTKKFEIE